MSDRGYRDLLADLQAGQATARAAEATSDLPLFWDEGDQRRQDGLDRIETHHATWLDRIRAVARRIVAQRGNVSADDLRAWADRNGCQPGHPNAWGAVFRGREWVPVGYVRNGQPSAHARRVILWTYHEAA